jgi:tubulin polyglutamylase TTLL4
LIDDKFKAWLMEVNVCPSLCSSSPFDKKIKHTLIVDLLNLVGINLPEPKN